MIKAGLFGIFAAVPLGTVAHADTGVVVTVAGLVTIFTALLLGAREVSPKAVLGYSSISQMGILACGVGVALMAPGTWAGILPVLVFLAVHHTLAKGALFLGTGAFSACTRPHGAMMVTVALMVPALILAGLPGLSGALGKEAMKAALVEGPGVWLPWLTLAVTLSGVVTTLLMARFAVQLWRKRPAAPDGAEPEALVVPFAALTLGAVALPALWPALAGPIGAAPILEAKAAAFWPIALGLVVALAAAIEAHTRTVGWRVFLAGLSAPVERYGESVQRAAARSKARFARRMRHIPPVVEAWLGTRRLGQTGIAALLVLVLLLNGADLVPASQEGEDAPGAVANQPRTLVVGPAHAPAEALQGIDRGVPVQSPNTKP
jgi:NADH:ubiquinone oxidoreductase subunit 5 (subunit L)/multisubunit Na+/H+ antiporter MnhA subunit